MANRPDSAGCEMLRALYRMFDCPGCIDEDAPGAPALVVVTLSEPHDYTEGFPTPEGPLVMATKSMMHNQEITVTFGPILDRQGRPTDFDGPLVWTSSNPEAVSALPNEGGRGGKIRSHTTDGIFTVDIRGDARKGDDIKPKLYVATLIVGPGDVETAELILSDPVDVTPDAPPA